MSIYCESQQGDMCRLHSINNYFGRRLLNNTQFFNYCDEYDKIIEGLHSRNMDGFAEGRSIISYVVDKLDNKFTLLIPIDSYQASRKHLDLERYLKIAHLIKSYFEFNKGHVWINKNINNKWYKIDSISGVHEINKINRFQKNHGYLLVIDDILLYKELQYNIDYLKNIHIDSIFDDNHEIVFCNLYHILKHIPTNIKDLQSSFQEDSKFIEKMVTLNIIKTTLYEFIQCRRHKYNVHNYKKILTKIYNLSKMIS